MVVWGDFVESIADQRDTSRGRANLAGFKLGSAKHLSETRDAC